MKYNPMENSEIKPKIILLDCDVISHFIANASINDLVRIFEPHQCVVLDYVFNEVAARPMRLAFLQPLIHSGKIKKMDFPEDSEINIEFARIKSKKPIIGDGERACMAVAKFKRNVVASSNYRDIAPYCTEHNIFYLGTLDILTVAVNKGIYDENKCDEFITNALTYNKACFPKGVTAMKYYTPKDLSFL
jgi:predicted nucleic acid-binding protein